MIATMYCQQGCQSPLTCHSKYLPHYHLPHYYQIFMLKFMVALAEPSCQPYCFFLNFTWPHRSPKLPCPSPPSSVFAMTLSCRKPSLAILGTGPSCPLRAKPTISPPCVCPLPSGDLILSLHPRHHFVCSSFEHTRFFYRGTIKAPKAKTLGYSDILSCRSPRS